jgi:hypothetical protein
MCFVRFLIYTLYTAYNSRIILDAELDMICNEVVVACFKTLSQHLSRRTEEEDENLGTMVSLGQNLTWCLQNIEHDEC